MTDATDDDNKPKMPANVVELALWKKINRHQPDATKRKTSSRRSRRQKEVDAEYERQDAACEEFMKNRVQETLLLASHYFDLPPSVFVNYLHMETLNNAIDVFRDDALQWTEARVAPCYHDELRVAIRHRFLEDSRLHLVCKHHKPYPGCRACRTEMARNEERIAKERAELREAETAYAEGKTVKDVYRMRLEKLPRDSTRQELQRIFDAAEAAASDEKAEDAELVFVATLEEERDDADGEDGKVRAFLDKLLD